MIKKLQTGSFTSNRYVPLLAVLLFTTFLVSCNRKIGGLSFGNREPNELNIEEFQFDYFSAKSKIQFQDPHSQLKATANVRMRKDSVIWISLSASLGIEALRCLITTDSVFVIDRVNKEYLMLNYTQLSEKFNFNIDYHILQSIVLGSLPMRRKENDPVSLEGDYYVLEQENGDVEIKNYINSSSMKLIMVKMIEVSTDNKLNLNYGNFQYLNDYIFPYKSLVSLEFLNKEKRNQTLISVDYNKAQIEEKEIKFPFNVPQKFTRRQSI